MLEEVSHQVRSGAPPAVVFEVAARPSGALPNVDLFLPFYPEEGGQSLPREDLGPGLSITREWVQKMGGRFGAGNRADGGIWTWFSLPMRKPAAGGAPPPLPEAPVTPPALAPVESSGNPVRILVVEDNPINQRVFESMLEHLGYGCRLVANGQEALAALASERYDLVFMDCQMPVMDGYEATRKMRSGQPSHAGPIVALTAHALDGDREKCLEAGMDDYLAKPVSLKCLGGMLSKWLKPARED
jgi:CheY-like chemotaxis protein